MLTGDNEKVANKIASELGIDKVYSNLLPNEKVDRLEEIFKNKSEKEKVAFVGDGINDAPVLARADVGIAMGALGSDAAIEAADVVLMTDEPSKIAKSIEIARKTNKIVWQNIVFALSVKLVVLLLSAGGVATMSGSNICRCRSCFNSSIKCNESYEINKKLRKIKFKLILISRHSLNNGCL